MKKKYLQDSEKIYRKITKALYECVYIFDVQDQALVWVSDRSKEMLGYSADEIYEMADNYYNHIFLPEDVEIARFKPESISSIKDNEPLFFEYRLQHPNGSIHWVLDRRTVFSRNEKGEVEALLGVMTKDVTEAQARLIFSTKMAALGEMSGGIAHEINNPLTVIQARAFQLLQMMDANSLDPIKIKQAAESIDRTAEKIAKIIKSLRSFSREGADDAFEVVPIKQIIDGTLDFCRTRFYNHGVEIEVGPLDPDLELECQTIQIQQVLLNLLNNSFESIQNLDDRWVRIDVRELENEHIQIAITDSGKGVPKELQDKIMQPFFTTKKGGKGKGLGLSISSDIVRSHKGVLRLDEKAPHTTFTLELPKFQEIESQ